MYSTLTPLLTDKPIGQKQLTAIRADNSQDNIPMDDNESSNDDNGSGVGNTNINNNNNDDDVSLSAPNVLANVKLAKTVSEYHFLPIFTYWHYLLH